MPKIGSSHRLKEKASSLKQLNEEGTTYQKSTLIPLLTKKYYL